eukprot:scaffold6348_cov259-Pinguiococcus_pyrenoidosus.AAC.22
MSSHARTSCKKSTLHFSSDTALSGASRSRVPKPRSEIPPGTKLLSKTDTTEYGDLISAQPSLSAIS